MVKMKKFYFLLLISLVFMACQEKFKGYEVFGTIKNLEDNSMLYLYANGEKIDSTIAVGESFQFKGDIDAPTKVYLMVVETNEITTFWLENGKITFDAENGELHKAKVSGSPAQEEENILIERLAEVNKQMDALDEKYSEDMSEEQLAELNSEYIVLEEKEAKINQQFVREFPNSIVSLDVLSVYSNAWGKELVIELFEPFSSEYKNSENGKAISRYIELNKNPQIGDAYVDFEMEDVNGEFKRLSDVEGKVILLEFWASWCAPCRQENPNLVRKYQAYHEKGFEIYAVSLDTDKARWIDAIEKDGLTWAQVSDLDKSNEAGIIYGVSYIPDNFLIDEEGKIIARGLRGEELSNKLAELLQ